MHSSSFHKFSRNKLVKEYGRAALVVVTFGCLGLVLLNLTHAATTYSSVEPENGSLSGATTVTDSTASGGKSVKFGTTGSAGITCNLNATTANFTAQVSAATAGQTICLAAGSYGTWDGTNKAITIAAQAGVVATMGLDFDTGDSGFTIDGLTITGADILNGAKNITVRNSKFTAGVTFDNLANANILFDHNTHNNINGGAGGSAARIHLAWTSDTPSGVTIQNSQMIGGSSDGIQTGSSVTLLNNEIADVWEGACTDCHSDSIQIYGGHHVVIRGNYIHDSADGILAGAGTHDNLIENNVIELVTGRWGMELGDDHNSIVRHNTMVYGPNCEYSPCGHIMFNGTSTGGQVYDNIATFVEINDNSVAAVNTKNMVRSGATGTNFNGIPVFVGGSAPSTWAGFKLATGSPGISAASDGTNVGIN